MDTVDSQTRSKIMTSVGQKDTGAEILPRNALHRAGLRYRLHDRELPGSPDLVFPRFWTVVFVHSHGCYRSTIPKSRQQFWTDKFEANRSRDERNVRSLLASGWRVLTVWECALKGKHALPSATVAEGVKAWLNSPERVGEIAGASPTTANQPNGGSP